MPNISKKGAKSPAKTSPRKKAAEKQNRRDARTGKKIPPVAGIGASAGGLKGEPVEQILLAIENVTDRSGR